LDTTQRCIAARDPGMRVSWQRKDHAYRHQSLPRRLVAGHSCPDEDVVNMINAANPAMKRGLYKKITGE
jgi:hypothetical protein